MRTIFLLLLLMQAGILHAQDTLQLPPHTPPAAISNVEYFFDTDPGFGSGLHFSGTTSGTILSLISSGSITSLSQGVHKLHIRTQDTFGGWSMTQSRSLYIIDSLFSLPTPGLPEAIDRFEYFLDADPGVGNGNVSVVPASFTAELTNIPVGISGLATGVHMVHVRFRDTSGVWSLTTVSKLALVSVDISFPEGQAADSISAMEYFFDEDPGVGNGILITVPATADLENYTFAADISMLADGMHGLFVRTLSGRSLTTMYNFMVGEPLALELVSFSAKQQDNDALLSWNTKAEATIDKFILESSSDGAKFIPFDSVSARNLQNNTYTCRDKGISRYNTDRIYYRLKMTEEDGGYSYAPVVPLHIEGNRSLVYPNPFFKDLHIMPGSRFGSSMISIKILDMSGRCIYEGSAPAGHGYTASPEELLPGNYLLSVESDIYKEIFLLTRR